MVPWSSLYNSSISRALIHVQLINILCTLTNLTSKHFMKLEQTCFSAAWLVTCPGRGPDYRADPLLTVVVEDRAGESVQKRHPPWVNAAARGAGRSPWRPEVGNSAGGEAEEMTPLIYVGVLLSWVGFRQEGLGTDFKGGALGLCRVLKQGWWNLYLSLHK